MPSVGINGFGRIGRLVLRALLKQGIKVTAINDPFLAVDFMAYLFKYDSTHGTYPGTVTADGKYLLIDGNKIEIVREKDPMKIMWKTLGADVIIEATGIFNTKDKACFHLEGGAKYVLITAPSPDVPTFVMGVNEENFDPATMPIISMACSTTNCLAPLCKVLNDNFNIIEGLMTSVHAMTPSQKVVDSPGQCSKRESRGALQNIIPMCSGAALCIGRVLPELDGKITGMSLRVPVANVSVVDLTVRLEQAVAYEDIKKAIETACQGKMKGIMSITEDDVVSSDFNGNPHSCIVDIKSGIPLNKNFVKVIAWYDNEFAYSQRVVELIQHIGNKCKC